MGFRSTFVTNDYAVKWPEWLKEKYKNSVNFNLCASSKEEYKFYGIWKDLIEDFHKALHDVNFFHEEDDGHLHLTISILHECDGVTRYQLYKNAIVCSEPTPSDCWEEVDGITHNYCYECDRTIGYSNKELIKNYEKDKRFYDARLVADTALRTVQKMPDNQVRDLLYMLVLNHMKEISDV